MRILQWRHTFFEEKLEEFEKSWEAANIKIIKSFQCKFQFTMTSHDFPKFSQLMFTGPCLVACQEEPFPQEQKKHSEWAEPDKDSIEKTLRTMFLMKATLDVDLVIYSLCISMWHHWWCLGARTCLVLLGNNLPLLVRGPELQHDHIEVHVGPSYSYLLFHWQLRESGQRIRTWVWNQLWFSDVGGSKYTKCAHGNGGDETTKRSFM